MKLSKKMYNILIAVSAVVFVVSAVFVVSYFVESYRQAKEYDELANLVGNSPERPTGADSEGTVDPDNDTPTFNPTPTDPVYVTIDDPKTGDPIQVLFRYSQLYQMNTDMVGWMEIPNTSINYPVMHTPEDPEFYLKRSFYKEPNNHGCLFAQGGADIFTPSDNVTIYGHHMRDGSMFADLFKYQDYSFWEENKLIYFDTISEMHTYAIISVFVTTATVGKGFPYHEFINATDRDDFNDFMETCHSLELYDTGLDATYGDKLITLSTCEYTQINGRLVVVAKRIS